MRAAANVTGQAADAPAPVAVKSGTAAAVSPLAADTPVAKLHSAVEYADEKDVRHTFKLVPSWEADAKAGKLSSESPVGRALAGCHPGEIVSLRTPGGERKLRIISVGEPEA